MAVEIRKSEAKDVNRLKAISRRWFPADEYIDENWAGMDVLLRDNKVIGYADCKGNLLDGMLIDFDLHRQGHGTLLLKGCERNLFEQNEEIILKCFECSSQANSFYRKNGWKEKRRFFDDGNTSPWKVVYAKSREEAQNNGLQETR